MRIVDADILSYALYDRSPAHKVSSKLIEKAVLGELNIYMTPTTVLEAYNVLFWTYRVRPRKDLLEKLRIVCEALRIVPVSLLEGVDISLRENIPLGDGLLLATALVNRLPIIISNDSHIAKVAPKSGLIVENPLPRGVRRVLRQDFNK